MREVQVLQATKTAPNSRGRNNNYAVQIDRIRVAAYCRVSTDGDEQLGSFESQKLYYEEKIRKNKEWAMAGIFADEAITGTKIDKREGFQEMIRKCLNGEIDMILTKSISRFSRNTPDTIKYVRMLRDKNIAIMFEKENINTLDMNGEMLLTILSSLAQEEVESLSSNVKMGLQMKMKRGELVGFNGCFGYDYHQDTKTITVNETEAETVRLIYDMYLQGNGCGTIAKRLVELGIKNKRGTVEWHDHGVMGMIKNEKYKGDVLLGKTFPLLNQKSRLTDLLIDGKIEQEDYDEKKLSFQRKLHQITEEKAYLEENIGQQKNISRRMSQLRQTLENENALDEFDRIVFESIVEKVIVGGYDAEGNPTPYKLTFVLKCNQTLKVDNAKADYRANQKGKKVS